MSARPALRACVLAHTCILSALRQLLRECCVTAHSPGLNKCTKKRSTFGPQAWQLNSHSAFYTNYTLIQRKGLFGY